MTWKKDLDELKKRADLAKEMGGIERIANHYAQGRLTVRERIDLLLDKDTFHETGELTGKVSYDEDGEIKEFIEKAILDPNIVNSTHFLRRAINFFNGSKDVLSEQKKCTYPYYSIQFDSYGHPTPCLTGCPTNSNPTKGTDLTTYVQSHSFRMLQKELESCEKCRGSMMLCYYEPRLNFPLHQLILSSFYGKGRLQ